MGKVRSLFSRNRTGYRSQVVTRQRDWEVRQLFQDDGAVAGDLFLLYTPGQVRGVLILRSVPPEQDWEALDEWVLSQIDTGERSYLVEYYEGTYVTGLQGPAELLSQVDDEDE